MVYATVTLAGNCAVCLVATRLLETDQRILPSTDSHSDLAFEHDSLPPCYSAAAAAASEMKECGDYAPGQACLRTPFLQPSDPKAQPLRHFIPDDTSVDAADAVHGWLLLHACLSIPNSVMCSWRDDDDLHSW